MSNIPTEDTIVKMYSVEEEEWIRAIKSLLFRNSEEGLIPEVTVSDNGKVLTVVRGAWDKADAPSGGSGEAGYECTETTEQYFDDTVTTTPLGDYSRCILDTKGLLDAPRIVVTFDGVEYTCGRKDSASGGYMYGGGIGDFQKIPFMIDSYTNDVEDVVVTMLFTPTSGEHDISITAIYYEPTNISPCLLACIDSVAKATAKRAIQSAGIPDIREGTVEERNIDITNGSAQVTIDVSDHYRAEQIIGIIGIESLEKFRGDGKQIVVETFGVNGTEITVNLRSRTGENTLLDILRIQFTYIYKDNGGLN